MTGASLIAEARLKFHARLLGSILNVEKSGIPSNADRKNKASVEIAKAIVAKLGAALEAQRAVGQTSGKKFEDVCANFVETTFLPLSGLRPGTWEVGRPSKVFSDSKFNTIAGYEQYVHLTKLRRLADKDIDLAAALGGDYFVKPDIVIARWPEDDMKINAGGSIVDDATAKLSPLRVQSGRPPILHASISCKWTMRSDRSQNSRTEGLNLIKNRRGRVPHIAVIVGEPLPSRIGSIALGTGEIDCVYHFALPELEAAVEQLGKPNYIKQLKTMIDGKRLRDIADLPLDLAI